MEARSIPALVASAAVLVLTWGIVVFAVPIVARRVAMRMSPSVEQQAGRQALAVLDRVALQLSKSTRRAGHAWKSDSSSSHVSPTRPAIRCTFGQVPAWVGPTSLAPGSELKPHARLDFPRILALVDLPKFGEVITPDGVP